MFILIAVSIILLLSWCKTAKMCFLQSREIWIGCGPTDCAGFVLHEGTLTVCSGGRYLNLGDTHMGGKGEKWKWYPSSLFCLPKGKLTDGYMSTQKLISTRLMTHIFPSAELSLLSVIRCPDLPFNLNAVVGTLLPPAADNTAVH